MIELRIIRGVPFAHRALLALLCALPTTANAEAGKLWVQVQDPFDKPIAGVEIGVRGPAGSKVTGADGKAHIDLGKDTQENDWVVLQIIHSPRGKDLVMASPWDARALVPSFKDKAENYIQVVLMQRGDRAALTSPKVARGVAAQINNANSARPTGEPSENERKANLLAVAKQYGITAEDLDHAIRSFGAQAKDPYDVGLAALYQRQYPEATLQLKQSLQMREEEAQAAQERVADAAFFLGESLYGQGNYAQAALAYKRYLDIRKDDIRVLNTYTMTLRKAGDYPAAETQARAVKTLAEQVRGPDDPETADSFVNLASILQDKGNDVSDIEALMLYHRAVQIFVKVYGPANTPGATVLNNECLLLYNRRLYSHAEPSCRQAISINENLPEQEFALSANLINLGLVLEGMGKSHYPEAESQFRRGLDIRQKTLEKNHPEIATALTDLALLLYYEEKYDEAKPLDEQALAIDEATLGPNHPNVANDLSNLALLLEAQKNYDGAESDLRRALAILEQALGPNHRDTRTVRTNLQDLLQMKESGTAQK